MLRVRYLLTFDISIFSLNKNIQKKTGSFDKYLTRQYVWTGLIFPQNIIKQTANMFFKALDYIGKIKSKLFSVREFIKKEQFNLTSPNL